MHVIACEQKRAETELTKGKAAILHAKAEKIRKEAGNAHQDNMDRLEEELKHEDVKFKREDVRSVELENEDKKFKLNQKKERDRRKSG